MTMGISPREMSRIGTMKRQLEAAQAAAADPNEHAATIAELDAAMHARTAPEARTMATSDLLDMAHSAVESTLTDREELDSFRRDMAHGDPIEGRVTDFGS